MRRHRCASGNAENEAVIILFHRINYLDFGLWRHTSAISVTGSDVMSCDSDDKDRSFLIGLTRHVTCNIHTVAARPYYGALKGTKPLFMLSQKHIIPASN